MAMDAERQEQVAARIREFRGPRPQRVIADKAGVTVRAYQAWEAGGGINWENIAPLAEALGVSEERLLFGRDEPDPSQFERIERKLDALLAHFDVSPPETLDAIVSDFEQETEPPPSSDGDAKPGVPKRQRRGHRPA